MLLIFALINLLFSHTKSLECQSLDRCTCDEDQTNRKLTYTCRNQGNGTEKLIITQGEAFATGFCDGTDSSELVMNFPDLNLTEVTWLELYECFLSKEALEYGIIPNFEKVSTFLWKNNAISYLPSDLFANRKRLTSIHFKNNILPIGVNLAESIFNGSTNILSLVFSGNRLTKLPQRLFYGLKDLSTVEFDHNLLTELHEELFISNPNILGLTLSYNKFVFIPRLVENIN